MSKILASSILFSLFSYSQPQNREYNKQKLLDSCIKTINVKL